MQLKFNNDANNFTYRPDEAELFAKSTEYAYKQFRDKAALSRSMSVNFSAILSSFMIICFTLHRRLQ